MRLWPLWLLYDRDQKQSLGHLKHGLYNKEEHRSRPQWAKIKFGGDWWFGLWLLWNHTLQWINSASESGTHCNAEWKQHSSATVVKQIRRALNAEKRFWLRKTLPLIMNVTNKHQIPNLSHYGNVTTMKPVPNTALWGLLTQLQRWRNERGTVLCRSNAVHQRILKKMYHGVHRNIKQRNCFQHL